MDLWFADNYDVQWLDLRALAVIIKPASLPAWLTCACLQTGHTPEANHRRHHRTLTATFQEGSRRMEATVAQDCQLEVA